MRNLLKVAGLAVAVLFCLGAAALSYFLQRTPVIAPALNINAALTPDRISRGRFIYILADCDGCHSFRDFTRFGGPVVEARRGAGFEFPKEMGLPGRVAARNITPEMETGIGAWTDGEKIRAIRDGISRDGTALFPLMPYRRFRHLSDEDAISLVSYLHTLPPVSNKVARSSLAFPASVLMRNAPRPAGRVSSVTAGVGPERGEYLAAIAGCADCHTQSYKGESKTGMRFAGGQRFAFRGLLVVSANITPDQQTGIGRWSEQDFVEHFHQYREYVDKGPPLSGPENFTVMPWLNLCRLDAADLRALYRFLRLQRPVYHSVDSHPALKALAAPK